MSKIVIVHQLDTNSLYMRFRLAHILPLVPPPPPGPARGGGRPGPHGCVVLAYVVLSYVPLYLS